MKSKTSFLMALMMVTPMAFSQEQAAAEAKKIVSNEPIDIYGEAKPKEEEAPTDSELDDINRLNKTYNKELKLSKEKAKGLTKLNETTEKLQVAMEEKMESHVEFVQKKKELESKIALNNKKIKCLMEGSAFDTECDALLKKKPVGEQVDEVKTELAAPKKEEVVEESRVEEKKIELPTVTAVVEQPVVKEEKKMNLKVIPYAGVTNYKSDEVNLESESSGGLRLESAVNSQVSLGVGLNLLNLHSKNKSLITGGDREVRFNNVAVDLYSKYFFTEETPVRPYVGAGVSYNRNKINFAQTSNYYGYAYGNEAYVNHYMAGMLMAGTEVRFNKSVGLNIELQYARGMMNSITSSSTQNSSTNADQARLEGISKELTQANVTSAFAGLLIQF